MPSHCQAAGQASGDPPRAHVAPVARLRPTESRRWGLMFWPHQRRTQAGPEGLTVGQGAGLGRRGELGAAHPLPSHPALRGATPCAQAGTIGELRQSLGPRTLAPALGVGSVPAWPVRGAAACGVSSVGAGHVHTCVILRACVRVSVAWIVLGAVGPAPIRR